MAHEKGEPTSAPLMAPCGAAHKDCPTAFSRTWGPTMLRMAVHGGCTLAEEHDTVLVHADSFLL